MFLSVIVWTDSLMTWIQWLSCAISLWCSVPLWQPLSNYSLVWPYVYSSWKPKLEKVLLGYSKIFVSILDRTDTSKLFSRAIFNSNRGLLCVRNYHWTMCTNQLPEMFLPNTITIVHEFSFFTFRMIRWLAVWFIAIGIRCRLLIN